MRLATDEVYEKFHRPNGIGDMAGTVIPNPSGDVVAFAFLFRSGLTREPALPDGSM